MANIPIIGKPEFGPYPINMFYSLAAHKGLNLPGLRGTPGLLLHLGPYNAYPVRGLHVMGDYLYGAIGNKIYYWDTDFDPAALAGNLSTTTGPILMADDGTNIMVVDPGVDGYTNVGGTLTAIADADFPTPSSLAWQDGYFIVTEEDSSTFYISTAYDPTAWDALDYTTAESTPDDALAIISDHKELIIFGSQSIQFYYNSGNATFPFECILGSTIQEGIGAAYSVAAGDNTVFFLDSKGCVRRITGHSTTVISSRDIEKEINDLSTFSDAMGFYYAQEGHGFYVLTFPIGDITWVFDVTIQHWHKRRSYPVHPDGSEGRWRASCHAYFSGKHIIGDWEDGRLYCLDFDTYTDNGETIRRYFDFPAIGDGQKRIRHNNLKLDYKTGVGIVGTVPTAGVDPQAMLLWSDDGKKTWSNELTKSMGKIGEYDKEVNFRRLASSKRRIYRNIVSDPVEVVITGAKLT